MDENACSSAATSKEVERAKDASKCNSSGSVDVKAANEKLAIAKLPDEKSAAETVGGDIGNRRDEVAAPASRKRKQEGANSVSNGSVCGEKAFTPSAEAAESGGGPSGAPKVPPLKIVLPIREQDCPPQVIRDVGSAEKANVAGDEPAASHGNETPYMEYKTKKKRAGAALMRSAQVSSQKHESEDITPATATAPPTNGAVPKKGPLNDIQKRLHIRKQVESRRKNLFPVQPKPPHGFKDYLMNRKTYLLQSNAHERLHSMPMLQPPPSLHGPLKELFMEQERARYQLRKQHMVDKEKLVLTKEQEILRVHGKAARALANQPMPYSVCTILKDEEVYVPLDNKTEEKSKDGRSRYNGRMFLSWLEDVDDKWDKVKVTKLKLVHHRKKLDQFTVIFSQT